jgi:putative membrane protein
MKVPHGTDTAARDILEKRSAINLLLAFAIALKHHLREERGTYYDDLYPLVSHLPRLHDQFTTDGRPPPSPAGKQRRGRSISPFSMLSEATFANGSESSTTPEAPFSSLFNHDRRDLACQGTLIQGNLPLELANYLTNFAEHVQADRRLSIPLYNALLAGTSGLVEVLSNCERILRTPIPLAYNIAISQTGSTFRIANSSVGVCHSSSFSVGPTLSMGYHPRVHDHCIHPLRSTPYFLRN